MRYRMRFDKCLEMLDVYRAAPKPGWRVLLSPAGLPRWCMWARKFEERRARHPEGNMLQDMGFHNPWEFDTWEEFERCYS